MFLESGIRLAAESISDSGHPGFRHWQTPISDSGAFGLDSEIGFQSQAPMSTGVGPADPACV